MGGAGDDDHFAGMNVVSFMLQGCKLKVEQWSSSNLQPVTFNV